VDEEREQRIRWIKPGPTARQVYSLPQTIPWPDSAPPPSLEDLFLNLSALHDATRLASSDSPSAKKWEHIASMCEKCEEASVSMEGFEYSKALETLELAEQDHACAFVHWQRCICHLELRQPEQAMAAAYHAATLAPRCAVFWRVFGELCQERGLPAEAARAFERAFFGGERTPSVISGMKASGLLVPNPALSGDMLVSPAVARAILQVHIKSTHPRKHSAPRLRELALASLSSGSTADVALEATSALMSSPSPSPLDSCLHAEALWSSGSLEEARRLARECLVTGTHPDLPPMTLARMTRKILPEELGSLVTALHTSGVLTLDVTEELFATSDPSSSTRLESLVAKPSTPPQLTVLYARRLGKSRPRRAMQMSTDALSHPEASSEVRLMSARTLLEMGEHEKAAAAVSTVPHSERGNWGQFMLAESLWQMGHPEHALEILEKLNEDQDEALAQNIQMRLAQCRGFMIPLPTQVAISPTGRLVRPVLVSGSAWASVVAPSGLPSSSYIRVQLDQPAKPDEYSVTELARTSGESPLGSLSVDGKHDLLALAVDPDGRVFVGARLGEKWVGISLQ
jgi:tetratricopeptide (TPR) repeat protein